jgi:CBS domain containing-hemolysin-like protein
LAFVRLFSHPAEASLELIDYLLIFFISLALFSMIGVAIPDAWSKYAGEMTLARSYPLLHGAALLVWPILKLFEIYDELVKRLAGVADVSEDEKQQDKEEDFLTDLEQHKMEGAVDEEEQEMIENVLELTDTTAGEILTPRTDITAIEKNSDLETVLEIITETGHSRYPVYEDSIDNVIGMVYAKDLLGEIGKSQEEFNLTEKIREAYFVPETKSLRELLHEFQNQKLHIAVVLDEYSGVAGIVTLEDILEELVGEITDEYEQTPEENIVEIDGKTLDVDARVYIDDLNDKFELDLPEEDDYDTIGGFVFSHLGFIPKAGQQFDYRNLRFEVVDAEPRSVKRVRIEKLAESEDA